MGEHRTSCYFEVLQCCIIVVLNAILISYKMYLLIPSIRLIFLDVDTYIFLNLQKVITIMIIGGIRYGLKIATTDNIPNTTSPI